MNCRWLVVGSLIVLMGISASAPGAAGEAWRVVRSVRLLTKPGIGLRIKTLHPPELVTATGGRNGDYIRVVDSNSDAGWVYQPYLAETEEVAEEGESEEPPTIAASKKDGGIANAIDSLWAKPEPRTGPFHINAKVCGPAGEGDETETNIRKNRIDVPTAYHQVTFDAVDGLPFPVASTQRTKWTTQQLASIEPYEGVALTVSGYLVALKPQAGSSESCNCGWTAANETDWHMALVGTPEGTEKDALVVETTPRIRVNHPTWTVSNLSPWNHSPNPIRVSGWLLMDPQHKGHLNKYRNTLWELHPITKIEVMMNGKWIDLDQLTGGPS